VNSRLGWRGPAAAGSRATACRRRGDPPCQRLRCFGRNGTNSGRDCHGRRLIHGEPDPQPGAKAASRSHSSHRHGDDNPNCDTRGDPDSDPFGDTDPARHNSFEPGRAGGWPRNRRAEPGRRIVTNTPRASRNTVGNAHAARSAPGHLRRGGRRICAAQLQRFFAHGPLRADEQGMAVLDQAGSGQHVEVTFDNNDRRLSFYATLDSGQPSIQIRTTLPAPTTTRLPQPGVTRIPSATPQPGHREDSQPSEGDAPVSGAGPGTPTP